MLTKRPEVEDTRPASGCEVAQQSARAEQDAAEQRRRDYVLRKWQEAQGQYSATVEYYVDPEERLDACKRAIQYRYCHLAWAHLRSVYQREVVVDTVYLGEKDLRLASG